MNTRTSAVKICTLNMLDSVTLEVFRRICQPEDRDYTYTRRYDPTLCDYRIVRLSKHSLWTITWRKSYYRNRVIRQLLKERLIAIGKVVLHLHRKVKILHILYPTLTR